MNEEMINEIVQKVFAKAKTECAIHTNNALNNHIENSTAISYKTAERLCQKYIDKKDNIGKQSEHTINVLCQYLGYESFSDYVKQNSKEKISLEDNKVVTKKNWKLITAISLIVVVGLILGLSEKSKEPKCMVWRIDHYEKTDCTTSYTENIIPLDEVRLQTFKKVKVNITCTFFDETTGEPTKWYYKSGNNIEFYTGPGLHPVNGKTLKAITEHIVDKYVPIHTYEESSFAE
ncbi:hypothetical protein SAMN05192545_1639 [Maribacter dokdonensis]|uniref:Uncharacterized protein n=1 Tax=Maribacter dokdonensis TaxID=320912 RepID=A0ABY0UF30_9FLAO|nr:hypothetical protein [Maribacter dokdonensis]SDS57157.1 hypothetical protein SAMN05192545_1639 [Maribacter dokdonensis]